MLLVAIVMKLFLELQLVITLDILSHILGHVDAPSVPALEIGGMEGVAAMMPHLGRCVLQACLNAGLHQSICWRELIELHNMKKVKILFI